MSELHGNIIISLTIKKGKVLNKLLGLINTLVILMHVYAKLKNTCNSAFYCSRYTLRVHVHIKTHTETRVLVWTCVYEHRGRIPMKIIMRRACLIKNNTKYEKNDSIMNTCMSTVKEKNGSLHESSNIPGKHIIYRCT